MFNGADLELCDFRDAVLTDAKFDGARIGGAKFAGAVDVPTAVASLLGPDAIAVPSAVVGQGTT